MGVGGLLVERREGLLELERVCTSDERKNVDRA
jgi:hypothetical protein